MPHVFVFSYPIVRMSVAGFMLDCLRHSVIQGGMTLSARKVPARQFVIFKGLRILAESDKAPACPDRIKSLRLLMFNGQTTVELEVLVLVRSHVVLAYLVIRAIFNRAI